MRSPRRIVTLVVTLVAALAPAASAHAAVAAIGGLVIDGDTGLGVGAATVTLEAAEGPKKATADPSGRFLFAGLLPGSTGRLSSSGPAGWTEGAVDNVTAPDTGTATKNIEIHRNWSSVPGGAQLTATTPTDPAAPGCGADKALDGDHGTGWSAPTPTPPAEAPGATVQLPAAIDVSGFLVEPSAVCGHAAGAALGHFRIETSPDGTTWTLAAEQELGSSARGTLVNVPAADAAAHGVRFARLVLLSAQDATSPTIDVRELQVLGAGPNQPPSGTVATVDDRNYIKQVTKLRASFTDPDSAISYYLWDFDGDGTFDQRTYGPAVSHVWNGPGTYHVIVGARDYRGALGTTTLDVRIIDPNALVEAVPQVKPRIAFGTPDGASVMARVACASKCTFTAKMTVTTSMQRKLRLKHRTLASIRKTLAGAGVASWSIDVPQKTVTALRKAKLRKLSVRLQATAVDAQRRRATLTRSVTLR